MALDDFIKAAEKICGKNTVIELKKGTDLLSVPRFSSGILSVDIESGGGIPENKVIEIFGMESSAKSRLVYSMIAEITNRKEDNIAYLIEPEGALEVNWMNGCDINTKNLMVSRPKFAEEALDLVELAMQSGDVSFIGFDSIASLLSKEMLSSSVSSNFMGVIARLMGKIFTKIYSIQNELNQNGKRCTVAFINQIRHKIGVVYGSPETTPGGLAAKFSASIRYKLSKQAVVKDDSGDVYAQEFEFTTLKNKTYSPMRSGNFTLYTGDSYGYTPGVIDNHRCLVDYCILYGLIERKASWYYTSLLPNGKAQGVREVLDIVYKLPIEKLNEMVKKDLSIAIFGRENAIAFSFRKAMTGITVPETVVKDDKKGKKEKAED